MPGPYGSQRLRQNNFATLELHRDRLALKRTKRIEGRFLDFKHGNVQVMCERSFLGQKNIDININMQTYAKMKCTIVLQSICYFKTIFSSHTLVNGLGIRSIARHDNDNGVTPAMVCKSKGALCICISSPLCRFPFFLPQIYFIFVLLFLLLIGHYEQIATATIGICFTMGDTTKLCFS